MGSRGTETWGGENSILGGSMMLGGYFSIYRGGIRLGGSTRGPQAWPPRVRLPSLSLHRGLSGLVPNLLGSLLVQEKLIQSFFLRLYSV